MTSDSRPILDQGGGNLALDTFVLYQHIGTLLDLALEGTGIPPAQYAVYSQLGGEVSTPGHLVELLGLRPATLSGYLGAMESRGHLTRTRDGADRRSHRLVLTASGRAARDACRSRMRRAVTGLNAEVGTADDVRRMRAALGRLDAAVVAARARLRR